MKSKTSATDLAWAAGFFDGEGTTAYYGDHTFRLSIGQKGPERLEKFNSIMWGLGKIYGPDDKGVSYLVFNGPSKVQQVVAMMWTYLGPQKRDQAKDAITAWAGNKRKWQVCMSNGHDIRQWGGKPTCYDCWKEKYY